jgi:glucose-6-phosphate dehydrogenase-like protein
VVVADQFAAHGFSTTLVNNPLQNAIDIPVHARPSGLHRNRCCGTGLRRSAKTQSRWKVSFSRRVRTVPFWYREQRHQLACEVERANSRPSEARDGNGCDPRRTAEPDQPDGRRCLLVLFGASGDLTKRKLVPGLFNLAKEGAAAKEFCHSWNHT